MLSLPPIHEYVDIREFFKDLFQLNQTGTSHRKFADLLGWPSSLAGDIIQGRRGFAVARAAEFAKHFNMNGVDTERLIILALKSSEHSGVRQYVEDYLSKPGKAWQNPAAEEKVSTTGVYVFSPEDLTDQALASLFIFLVWCDGKTTKEEIGRLLCLSPELKDPSFLEKQLDKLSSLGLIAGELPEIQILQPNVGSSGMRKEQYFKTLEALKGLFEVQEPRMHWHFTRLVFPIDKYEELNQRVQALLNWMQNTCADPEYLGKDKYVILQVNFMITHLLDLMKAGLALKKEPSGRHRIEPL